MNESTSTQITNSPQDPDGVTAAVVESVADAEGVSPFDLQPLAEAVDPEALERLVSSMERRPDAPVGSVHFIYSGYDVLVDGDGGVVVSKRLD